MISFVFCEVTINNCRSCIRPVHTSADTSLVITKDAVYKLRRAVILDGNSTAVANVRIVVVLNGGWCAIGSNKIIRCISQITGKYAVYKFGITNVTSINCTTMVFNLKISVRSLNACGIYTTNAANTAICSIVCK